MIPPMKIVEVSNDEVSIVNCVSSPATGKNIPERPPSVNVIKNPSDHSVCVLNTRLPPQRVASQLKIFTPVGIATAIVVIMNAARHAGLIPLVSIWCPQTTNPTTPIPTIA